jgi:hypothetical protein
MVKIKDNWIRMNETMENGKVLFFRFFVFLQQVHLFLMIRAF